MKKKVLFLSLCLSLLVVDASCPLLTRTPANDSGNLDLYGSDPYTLDPALAGDSSSNEYVMQIFSGLVALDENLEPVPDIAENWDVSPDGLIYTFHLRHNVYFHGGRQVKAADFKYSWERAASPATGSQTAATYLGDIAGVSDVLAGRSTTLQGVVVLDEYTLQVTLKSPKSYFLAKLSYVTSFVVDRADVAGDKWWLSPNGTGPFKLKSWQKGDSLVLACSDNYYGDKARLQTVTYHILSGIPMNMYEQDELDIAEVDASYYDLVTDPAGVFSRVLTVTPQLSLEYLAFDITKPPFDDVNVRKAFALAVDKPKITALLFRNTVHPAEGVLPPGMPDFNPYLIGLPFDTARAREYLAASKYASGMPVVTLTLSGYGGQISSAFQAIIFDWKQYLGIDVAVRQLEPEEFLYNINAEKDNLVDFSWNADYAHPQNFLEVLFGQGMEYNVGGYGSAVFNGLLQSAGAEPDEAKSLQLYQQAEQVLINDAACIPLWTGESYTLIKPYVHGYVPSPLGIVRLDKVWLQN